MWIQFGVFVFSVWMTGGAAAHRVTACQSGSQMTLNCSADDRIVVRYVAYAYDPKPCNAPSADNDCTTKSHLLLKEVASRCNSASTCTVDYKEARSLPSEIFSELRDPGQCQIGDTFYASQDYHLNYMAISYDCMSFTLCNEYVNERSKNLVVKTASYPSQMPRTNPACQCEFSLGDRNYKGLSARARCPTGTVTFRVRSRPQSTDKSVYPDAETDFIDVPCTNVTAPGFVNLMTVNTGNIIVVTVNEDKSDERSAYLLTVLPVKFTDEYDRNAPVNVSCQAGGIFLTRSERLIIYITLPVALVLLIALIVVCKVVKRRRRRRAAQKAAAQKVATQNRASKVPSAPPEFEKKPSDGRPLDLVEDGVELSRLLKQVEAEQHHKSQPRPDDQPALPSQVSRSKRGGSPAVKHFTEQIRDDPDGDDLVHFATLLHKKRLQQEELASIHGSASSSRPASRPVSIVNSGSLYAPVRPSTRPRPSAPLDYELVAPDVPKPLPSLSYPDIQTSIHKVPSTKRMQAPPPPLPAAPAAGTTPLPSQATPIKPHVPPKPSKLRVARNESTISHVSAGSQAPPKPSRLRSEPE